MKRPAAALEQTRPGKKVHHDVAAEERELDPTEQTCSTISAALMGAADTTISVREMLSCAVPHCLAVFKDERHKYQQEMVDMIEEALVGKDNSIKQSISDAELVLGRKDEQQVERAAKLGFAIANLEESQHDLLRSENNHADNMRDLSKAEEDLLEAVAASAERFMERDAISFKRECMEAAEKDSLIPLKEGSVDKQIMIKKKISSLTAMGKSMQLDASLLQAFPGVLQKSPAERGKFDLIILQELEEEFSKCYTAFSAQLEAILPIVKEHEVAVKAATELRDQAQEKCNASETDMHASSDRKLECEEGVRSAEQALENLEPEFQDVVAKRNGAVKELAIFQSNLLTPLRELKERTRAGTNCKGKLDTHVDSSTVGDEPAMNREMEMAVDVGSP